MTPQTDVPAVDSGAPAAAPTNGFATSEFATSAAAIVALASGLIPQQYVPAIAAVAAVYTALRTLLKAVHTLGYAKSVPDLPVLPPLPAGSITTTTVPRS